MADPVPLFRLGSTKYFTPELAPSVKLNSKVNSKLENLSLVIISPPLADSAPPLASTVNTPSSITQPCCGKWSSFAPIHPSVDLPSQSKRHPRLFSCSVSVLGIKLSSVTLGSISHRCLSRFSDAIRIFLHLTWVPSLSLSFPMPCTWNPIKPSAVISSTKLAVLTPLIHTLMVGPMASTRYEFQPPGLNAA